MRERKILRGNRKNMSKKTTYVKREKGMSSQSPVLNYACKKTKTVQYITQKPVIFYLCRTLVKFKYEIKKSLLAISFVKYYTNKLKASLIYIIILQDNNSTALHT